MKKIYYTSIVFILMIFSLSCKTDPYEIALNTTNDEKGVKAVDKLFDQEKLMIIALTGKRLDICQYALDKISDQQILERMVGQSSNFSPISDGVVKKIIDVDIANRVALRVLWSQNIKILLEKVTDQFILAEIYLLHKDTTLRNFVKNKITDKAIFKFDNALSHIPEEHSSRIRRQLFPLLQVLRYNEIQNIIGDIVSIRIDLDSLEFRYSNNVDLIWEVLEIELDFTKHDPITYENIPDPAEEIFVEEYNSRVYWEHKVNVVKFLDNIFKFELSDSLWLRIAAEIEQSEIRSTAIKKIKDQEILHEIATYVWGTRISEPKNEILSQNTYIVTVANYVKGEGLNDDYHFGTFFAQNLVDRELLLRIAFLGKGFAPSYEEAKEAFVRLSDLSLIETKVKRENHLHDSTRLIIFNEVQDNSLFEEIACYNENMDENLRIAAIKRLNNEQILHAIIDDPYVGIRNVDERKNAAKIRLKELKEKSNHNN